MEQVTLEGGNQWTVPWLLTTIPEPPWATVARPLQQSILHPHSKLLDPRWAVAVGGYVADTVELQERLHKHAGMGVSPEGDPKAAKPKGPKYKAKAKGKGDAQAGADPPAKGK